MTTVVIIALAYTLFLQTVLLQDNLDITSNIAALGCYAMLERVLKATNEFIVAYFIMRPFKLAATQHISQAIADRSPSALLLMKGNAYTFHTSAVRALTSLVENGIGLITPIVLLVSRGAAIGLYLTAEQTLIVFAGLTFVFLAGSAILIYDHRVKEKLSKTETAVEERARSVMTSIATVVINGAASVLPKWMTALKMEEIIPSKLPFYVGSLHGLSYRILQKYYSINYTILDEYETRELIKNETNLFFATFNGLVIEEDDINYIKYKIGPPI
jgi:hypothetical protein